MIFEYDEQKSKRNIEIRGISFELASDLDWHLAITWRDDRKDYAEIRECALVPSAGRVYSVTFTMRNEKIRIISLRKANKREVKRYEKI